MCSLVIYEKKAATQQASLLVHCTKRLQPKADVDVRLQVRQSQTQAEKAVLECAHAYASAANTNPNTPRVLYNLNAPTSGPLSVTIELVGDAQLQSAQTQTMAKPSLSASSSAGAGQGQSQSLPGASPPRADPDASPGHSVCRVLLLLVVACCCCL